MVDRNWFRPARDLAMLLAGAATVVPAVPAVAQSLAYGNVSGGDGGGDSAGDSSGGGARSGHGRSGQGGARGRTYLTPYIEAAQIVRAELSPGSDVLTYSEVAAGLDVGIDGARSGGSLSVRYERRFGWGKKARDSDAVSGIGRGYVKLARGLQIDAGAMAGRTRIEESGAAVLGPLAESDRATQVYSVYAGPTVKTRVGDVSIDGGYHAGYSRVENPHRGAVLPGQQRRDVYDDGTTHLASIHAGTKAGDVLPVGLGAGANYHREDVSNLDQRIEDFSARADVTVPVGHELNLVGGVGYEDVTVSSRDALRDASGLPVVGRGGRYVTDKSGPRRIAFDTSGLIWDAGVVWRPSRRTALEAHVGRRYGSTTYYGSFAYAPNARSSLNISVYDNMAGFGGMMTQALVDLPTQFSAVRNPLAGDIGGCVQPTGDREQLAGTNNCFGNALGSVRSSVFRSRGVTASYGMKLGSLSTGIGAGYDRRKFIGAPGTILAEASGVTDENIWLAAYLNGRIDQNSSFGTNLYAYWFQSGSASDGDSSAVGASAAYNRLLTQHLSATAAVGLDGINRQGPEEDSWVASALFGVRYSF